jgi:hypothetical protein
MEALIQAAPQQFSDMCSGGYVHVFAAHDDYDDMVADIVTGPLYTSNICYRILAEQAVGITAQHEGSLQQLINEVVSLGVRDSRDLVDALRYIHVLGVIVWDSVRMPSHVRVEMWCAPKPTAATTKLITSALSEITPNLEADGDIDGPYASAELAEVAALMVPHSDLNSKQLAVLMAWGRAISNDGIYNAAFEFAQAHGLDRQALANLQRIPKNRCF